MRIESECTGYTVIWLECWVVVRLDNLKLHAPHEFTAITIDANVVDSTGMLGVRNRLNAVAKPDTSAFVKKSGGCLYVVSGTTLAPSQ